MNTLTQSNTEQLEAENQEVLELARTLMHEVAELELQVKSVSKQRDIYRNKYLLQRHINADLRDHLPA